MPLFRLNKLSTLVRSGLLVEENFHNSAPTTRKIAQDRFFMLAPLKLSLIVRKEKELVHHLYSYQKSSLIVVLQLEVSLTLHI